MQINERQDGNSGIPEGNVNKGIWKESQNTDNLIVHIYPAYSGDSFSTLHFFASWASANAFSLAK